MTTHPFRDGTPAVGMGVRKGWKHGFAGLDLGTECAAEGSTPVDLVARFPGKVLLHKVLPSLHE